jgi:uncharacterized membrane protein
MSSERGPANEPKPAPVPSSKPSTPQWNPVVTTLMILLGFPLLLPGVCGLIFSSGGGPNPLALAGIFIALCGIVMIIFGIRRLMTSAAASQPAVNETLKVVVLLILLVIVVVVGIGLASIFSTVLRN